MKKMGFFGVAFATTFNGEVTFAFATGLETVNGKSFDPFFQGAVVSSSAGGAGVVKSLDGDHVIGSGGIDGKLGCAGAEGGTGFFVVPVPQEIRRAIAVKSTKGSTTPRHARGEQEVTSTLMAQTSIEFPTGTATAATSGGKEPVTTLLGDSYR